MPWPSLLAADAAGGHSNGGEFSRTHDINPADIWGKECGRPEEANGEKKRKKQILAMRNNLGETEGVDGVAAVVVIHKMV